MATLGQLVSGIAQEIEKPVSAGLKYSAQIQTELAGPDANPSLAVGTLQQHSGQIQDQLQKIADLMSAFRLIAVDPSTATRQRVYLAKLLEQVEQQFSAQLQQQQIDLQLHCDPQLQITSYPDSWKQVLSQLIDNSMRHGFGGEVQADRAAAIRIEITHQAEAIHLTYTDNGVGIPEQILPRIFEPFVASRSEHGGSGLGAHVVYRLISDLFKGTIRCQSRRGHGVEFNIRIPLHTHDKSSDSAPW